MAKFKFVGDPHNWEWVKKQDGSREKQPQPDKSDGVTLFGIQFKRGEVVDVDDKLEVVDRSGMKRNVAMALAQHNHFKRADEPAKAPPKVSAPAANT